MEACLEDVTRRIRDAKLRCERAKLADALEGKLCCICQDAEREVLLLPCKHFCLCSKCASHESLRACPICRGEIQEKIRAFT